MRKVDILTGFAGAVAGYAVTRFLTSETGQQLGHSALEQGQQALEATTDATRRLAAGAAGIAERAVATATPVIGAAAEQVVRRGGGAMGEIADTVADVHSFIQHITQEPTGPTIVDADESPSSSSRRAA